MSRKILLVEDDGPTAEYLCKGLSQEGFAVDHVESGRDGLFMGADSSYDLIILDRMLPELDGLAVLSGLRAAKVLTPVLILSALSSMDERVNGLRAGGDDYLVKPFGFAELIARVEALLRRGTPTPTEIVLTCGDLEMDLIGRTLRRGDQTIDLQPREFRLLEYLLRNKGRVVSRSMLLDGVWNYNFDPGTNVIDVQISRLRHKIDRTGQPPLIHTLRGIGYKLSEKP